MRHTVFANGSYVHRTAEILYNGQEHSLRRRHFQPMQELPKPKIALVVPILNSRRFLSPCLEAMIAAVRAYGNSELFVMDNGSTDGTWEELQSHYSSDVKIQQLKGVTISALRNRGAALSSSDYISFIDADCSIEPDYFDKAVQVFSVTGADASGSRHLLPPNPCWLEETWETLHAPVNDGAINFVPSGNFTVSRKAFEAVGGFDENLLTGEDTELCQRLRDAGFAVHSAKAISAIHFGNPKRLSQFFRKEIWHGIGMFGTFRHAWLDKPVIMTFAHLLLLVAAVLNLALTPMALIPRLATSLLLVILAPAVTIAYRFVALRRVYRPLRSLLLYELYLTARIIALFRILGGASSVRRQRAPTVAN